MKRRAVFRPFLAAAGLACSVMMGLAFIEDALESRAASMFDAVLEAPDLEGWLRAPAPRPRLAQVRVIDGDTLVLDGVPTTLAHVDALELGQQCATSAGLVACGERVRAVVVNAVTGRAVLCTPVDAGRANCTVDGVDLASWLVSRGLAVAHPSAPAQLQTMMATAQAAGVGMWATGFEWPAQYRAGRPVTTPPRRAAPALAAL